jgi:LPXTG-motif cell wall-anchored protein
MKHTRILYTLFLFAAGMWLLPAKAGAQGDAQRRAMMTLTEPAEIPGTVLQPGTYVVKVMDYRDEKEIVQFSSEDEKTVFATVLAIRDRRVRTDDGQTGFVYFQRLEGSPIALKSWYYGGDEWGEVFVYPRSKAVVIAQATHEPVVATPVESHPTLQAEVTVIKPEPAPKPALEPVAVDAKTPVAVAEKKPVALPRTGSSLPLFGLIGLGAFGAAAAIHFARRMA